MTSTSYPENAQDWRGRFIFNLATALARRDDLNLSLWAPPGDLPQYTADATSVDDKKWLGELSKNGGIAHLLRTRRVTAAGTALNLLNRLRQVYRRQASDIVHVNWLQNALPLWGTNTPALVTVLGTDFGLLNIPGMKAALRLVMRTRRTILAPNAEWMCDGLEEAFGDLAEVRTIPFGVDAPWFEVARRPPDDGTHHWLAVTRLTKNKIGDLFEWGRGLFGERRQLHLFGPMQEHVEIPPWVKYHGATNPAELLQEWFPRACGLITLSRHDEGRPQVMLEAMAAGIPVLATDMTAHRDMLQHGSTGWLAATRDEFCQGLDWLENPVNSRSTGQAASQWIKDSIGTWDDCASSYVAAYQSLLEQKS